MDDQPTHLFPIPCSGTFARESLESGRTLELWGSHNEWSTPCALSEDGVFFVPVKEPIQPGPIEVHFKLRWADDGTWLLDPTFPTTSESPEPINNCVQLLGRPVPVIVEWPGEEADFGVAGTFSSWRVLPLDSMTQTCEIVALPGWKYEYKFIVNGEWTVCDRFATTTDSDGLTNHWLCTTPLNCEFGLLGNPDGRCALNAAITSLLALPPMRKAIADADETGADGETFRFKVLQSLRSLAKRMRSGCGPYSCQALYDACCEENLIEKGVDADASQLAHSLVETLADVRSPSSPTRGANHFAGLWSVPGVTGSDRLAFFVVPVHEVPQDDGTVVAAVESGMEQGFPSGVAGALLGSTGLQCAASIITWTLELWGRASGVFFADEVELSGSRGVWRVSAVLVRCGEWDGGHFATLRRWTEKEQALAWQSSNDADGDRWVLLDDANMQVLPPLDGGALGEWDLWKTFRPVALFWHRVS